MTDRQFIKDLHGKARKAIKKAVGKALLAHEAAGVPAMIWKNGKVVALRPKKKARRRK